MMEQHLAKSREKTNSAKGFYLVFALCVGIVAFTGLESTIAGTLFFILLSGLVVFGRKDETLIVYLVLNVFFGYSEIKVRLLIGGTLAPSTVTNLFSLLILLKLLLFRIRMVLNAKWLITVMLTAYIVLSSLLTNSPVFSAVLMSQLIIVFSIMEFFEEGNEESLKKYTICFVLVMLGEVIFGLMFNTNQEQYGWRALQFTGVADPNNLSLGCNCLLAIITACAERIGLGKVSGVMKVGLCVVVVCTLSFSGIVSMVCILLIGQVMKKMCGGRRLLLIVAIFAVAIPILVWQNDLFTWLQSSRIPVLRGLGERLLSMSQSVGQENMDAVTSGRTILWERWMEQYAEQNLIVQLFGSSRTYAQLVNQLGHAPHNVYIDILVKYGLIGFALFALKILHSVRQRIVKKDYVGLWVSAIMLANLFARSMGVPSAVFYGLLS